MRNNLKFYKELGKKFCIFALISLFLFSVFTSYCIIFNLNSKGSSTYNEHRPIHSSAETIIQNQEFSLDVNIMAQNIRYINCTFHRSVSIRSNSTDSANVTFTDCSFLSTYGSSFLSIWDNSTVNFWNKSGENSIIARTNVYLYDNCTLIVNQTNLGSGGGYYSPVHLQDETHLIFLNSTLNYYTVFDVEENSTLEIHNTTMASNWGISISADQNGVIYADSSTLHFSSIRTYHHSKLILSNTYIDIDVDFNMDESSWMVLANGSVYSIPWYVVTPWITGNARIDCIDSTIGISQMYLQDNATLSYIRAWHAGGVINLKDNATLIFLNATCSWDPVSIGGGSPKLIFNNSVVDSEIQLSGNAQNPQISLYQSNFSQLFSGFNSYNHNTSITIIECNSENAWYNELYESNAFGRNSTVFISNSHLERFGVIENCTLTVINTTFTGELGLYSGYSNSYLSTNLKNVQVGKLIYGNNYKANWDNLTFRELDARDVNVRLDAFQLYPLASGENFNNVFFLNTSDAVIFLSGVMNATIENLHQPGLVIYNNEYTNLSLLNSDLKLFYDYSTAVVVNTTFAEALYLLGTGTSNLTNCIAYGFAIVGGYTDGERYLNNCTFQDYVKIGASIEGPWGPNEYRNVIAHFTECKFKDMVEIWVASSLLQTFEDVAFEDLVWVKDGVVSITKAVFKDPAFFWLQPGALGNATIADSTCTIVRANENGTMSIENSSLDYIYLNDESVTVLSNVLIGHLMLSDIATLTAGFCEIEDYLLNNLLYFINDSYVLPIAPTVVIQSKNTVSPFNVTLNWIADPGFNLTGNVEQYSIYKANYTKGTTTVPTDAKYRLIGTISNPNLANNADLTFVDLDIKDNSELWYKVGILDEGGNYANSSAIHEQFVSGSNYAKLRANIFRDPYLTTFDNVTVEISLIQNDINFDLLEDLKNVTVEITYIYNNGLSSYMEVFLPTSISEAQFYNFTIIKNYTIDYLYFRVLVYPDGYDFSQFGFISEYFYVYSPLITFSPVQRPAVDRIPEGDTIIVQFYILDDDMYLQNVTLFYKYSESSDWVLVLMPVVNKSAELTISFNGTMEQFYFRILAFDLAGNSYDVLDTQSFIIYPALPMMTLDETGTIMIVIGSSLVGLIIGLTYITAKRSTSSKSDTFLSSLKGRLELFLKKVYQAEAVKKEDIFAVKKITRDIYLDPLLQKNSLGKIYLIGLIGLLLGIGSSFYLAQVQAMYEIATLILLGMVFLAIYIYVTWLYRATLVDIRLEKLKFHYSLMGYINAILILVVTILMLQVGVNIPWVRYYVVEQSGTPGMELFGLVIPNLYIKIVSITFSSLIAFSLSVDFELRKNIKSIDTLQKRNASISAIIYAKEDYISKINGRINLKVVIFLVLLGFALIPYSSEGFGNLLPTGLLIVAPCFLVFIIFFFISFFVKREGSKPFLLEPSKYCQECGTQNTINAIYCRSCRAKIVSEQVLYGKTVNCKLCGGINPVDSNYCMNCAEPLEEKGKGLIKNLPKAPPESPEPKAG
jgi:hypothetical protein